MNELLLCALLRRGRPGAAFDLVDEANALAMDAGWPRRYHVTSVNKAAAALGHMARNGVVRKAGTVKDCGNERPLWEPVHGYDRSAPIPDPPSAAKHPLDAMTRSQLCAVFDVLDELVMEGERQRRALAEYTRTQLAQFESTILRAKRQLAAVGLPKEDE